MKIQEFIEKIYIKYKEYDDRGKVASYIPELAKVNEKELAISIKNIKGYEYSIGDIDTKFTIQSISKVLALTLAIEDNGIEKILDKVDIKPTSDGFNQFYKLDLLGDKKPLNPMINLGALSTTALINDKEKERIDRLIEFIYKITGNDAINYNKKVYLSEKNTGFRNKSMAYMLEELGNITDADDVLDSYFKQCSIELDVDDLSKIAYFYSTHGVNYFGEELINKDTIRIVNSIMATSGMYNYSGEYAATVGIPSKSGVSGCIMGIVPNRYGIAVYSPGLDKYGNSKIGNEIMKELSREMDLSIY